MKKILACALAVVLAFVTLISFNSCGKGSYEITEDKFMEIYTKYYSRDAEYKKVEIAGKCFYLFGENGQTDISVDGEYDLLTEENYEFIYTDFKPNENSDYWKLYVKWTPEIIKSVINSFSESGTWKYYKDGDNITMTVSHGDSVLMSRTFGKNGYLLKETGGYNEVEVKKYIK